MSFEQDPNEQANISGADLAIMVDEMQQQKALIRQLGFALIEAWPMVHQPFTSDTRKKEVERAMFAFRDWCGPDDQPGMLPTLTVGSFNPWKDEIVIDGRTYKGDFFRNNERAELLRDAKRYRYMRASRPGLYWYLPRTPELGGLSPDKALDVNIDANMKGSNYE